MICGPVAPTVGEGPFKEVGNQMRKNKMRLLVIGFAVVLALAPPLGELEAQSAAGSITEAEIREHIYYLASDELRGRDTGSEGYELAARYAAAQLLADGVLPVIPDQNGELGYLQPLAMSKRTFGPGNAAQLSAGGGSSSLDFGTDYFVISNSTREREEISGSLVFVGYGIEDSARGWNDLEGLDLSGSIPIAMFGLPGEDITAAFAGENPGNPWAFFQGRIAALEARGAVGVVVVLDPGTMRNWDRLVPYFAGDQLTVGGGAPRSQFPEAKIPVVFLGAQLLSELFAGQGFDPISLEGTYSTFALEGAQLSVVIQIGQEALSVPNVVGMVEGSDPALKDEYVVVGAHLDHVGVRDGEIYNGADDNASGSVGVLEVAEAIAQAPPRRSVIFVLYTGEERGILGSRHFVENPPVPLERIVANVNIEMIGRWSHRPPETIFAILGTDDDGALRDALTRVNEAGFGYDLEAPERFLGGSDHMAFQAVGIPNITIAGSPPSGTHEDYHGPGDEADKIEIPAMRKATALIYELTLELANRGGR